MEHEEDLLMFITCESNIDGNTCNGYGDGTVTDGVPTFGTSIFPTENSKVIENSISPATASSEKEIHTYKLYLQFKDDGSDQSIDMGKTIQGHVQIYDPKDIITLSGTVTGYTEGAYVEMHSDVKTSQIDSNGRYVITGVKPDEHELYVKYVDKEGVTQTSFAKDIKVSKGETASVSSDGTDIVITNNSVETNIDINVNNSTLENANSISVTNNKNSITLKLTDDEITTSDETVEEYNEGEEPIYYGTYEGSTSDTPISVPIVDFSVAGSGVYTCEYTLEITVANEDNLYEAYLTYDYEEEVRASDALNLLIDGKKYSLREDGLFPMKVSGKLYGISANEPISIRTRLSYMAGNYFTADALLDKSLTLNFKVDSIECVLDTQEENIAFEDTLGGQLIAKYPGYFTEELVGGMYRYQDSVTLKICLGLEEYDSVDYWACSVDEQTSGDIFTIVGITEDGKVKGFLDSNFELNWNNQNSGTWATSSLYENLNDEYLLYGLSYQYLIANHDWKYGTYSYLGTETTDEIYEAENAWSNTVTAKVGLLNISDILYMPSYYSGTYLITSKNEYQAYAMGTDGLVSYDKTTSYSVLPAIYLKSSANYVKGDGFDEYISIEY